MNTRSGPEILPYVTPDFCHALPAPHESFVRTTYGQEPLLILSSHGVDHLREGNPKKADRGTFEFGHLLARTLNASFLGECEPLHMDSNHHQNTQFKRHLADVLLEQKPRLVFDIHSSHPGRPHDVEIGTRHGRSLLQNTQYLPSLQNALSQHHFFVLTDQVFCAEGVDGGETLTEFVSATCGTPAIQLEICSAYVSGDGGFLVIIADLNSSTHWPTSGLPTLRMKTSLLILEKLREPEHSLFLSVGAQQGVHVEHLDVRALTFQGIKDAMTPLGRSISQFSAVVLRTYEDVALVRQAARIAQAHGRSVWGYDPFHPNAFANKLEDHFQLERCGVPQPAYWIPAHCDSQCDMECVAKKGWGFGGFEVELVPALRPFNHPVHEWFAQERLTSSLDWRIYLDNGKALPWAVERTPASNDFRSNLH
jgi:hypothetical protein